VKRAGLETRILVLVTMGLTAFGAVMVYSATSSSAVLGGTDPMYYLKRQAIYAVLGLLLMVVASRTDFRKLRKLSPAILTTSLVLCLAVLVLGTSINGAKRWISLGPIAFQPSELAKLGVCIWAAVYLARKGPPRTLKELARPVGLVVGVFALLLLAEPDLGTAIALVLMLAAMLLVAGTRPGLLGLGGGIVVGVALLATWVEPYRRARLFAFLHPWHDVQGAGYQTAQAIISVASGGLLGKGLGNGPVMSFLPEAHTDMIFGVIGEELGLIGVMAVIAAFLAFAYAGFRVALSARDPFGKFLATGIVSLVCAQAAVNLAAVLGLAPLTGIPLPFVSYGGSSLVLTLTAVGVVLNIAVNGGKEARVRDSSRRNGRSRGSGTRSRRSAAPPRRQRELRRVAGSG
jgi:cell division protein FtsW